MYSFVANTTTTVTFIFPTTTIPANKTTTTNTTTNTTTVIIIIIVVVIIIIIIIIITISHYADSEGQRSSLRVTTLCQSVSIFASKLFPASALARHSRTRLLGLFRLELFPRSL
ncbi:hypothetical protein E2C01_089213 [Portunus trituberculatus]|uniref:Uncharacterized protein n=1 Tax=Portunus trituberculatus TaxID=210409 RepID=A0A5B7JCX5_PORTR|nr:hypothetical protein [Portunus trituberculatus]